MLEVHDESLILSKHAIERLQQRGVPATHIELIARIGTEVEGGVLMLGKDCDARMRELRREMQLLEKVRGKRVVLKGNHVITVYHADQKKERKLLRGIEKRNLYAS